MTTKQLLEKRTKTWETAKAFLDSKRDGNGIVSAEDTATYEKLETEIFNLGKEIERQERRAALDYEIAKSADYSIKKPSVVKTGRASDDYNQAFWNALRGNKSIEVLNALQIGTEAQGGFLVPDEYELQLIKSLEQQNVFRRISTVIKTSNGDRKIPIVTNHGTASWTDEAGAILESDESFGQIYIGTHKLATMLKVSEELINDSGFNIEQYIADEFARRIGKAEEEAFTIGNGESKPTGVLTGAELGLTTSGSAITYDDIIDLYHSLRTPYRSNAVFLANDSTLKSIRKLKDGNEQYMWQRATCLQLKRLCA